MRIAIFTDTYLPQINGVVTSTLIFASEFQKLGHEVFILCPQIKGVQGESKNIWRFKALTYPFQSEYKIPFPFSRRLAKFKALNIDIIHAQTPFTLGYLAQFLGWQYKIPVVFTYHTLFTEYIHYLSILPKRLMKRYAMMESRNFCNRCEQIIAPSYQIKRKLVKYSINSKIEVIPTGIEVNNQISQKNINDFLNEYSISESQQIFIYAGRLGKEKNVYFLIESFYRILKELPNAILLICGDGPERNNIELKAKELEINHQIIFTGYLKREKLLIAFAASHVSLFPSITETQGLTVIESLAAGTPVIGINKMGVGEILKNNFGGFLSTNGVEQYSQYAISLIQDQVLYKKKQQEALSRAQNYSSVHLANKTLNLYDRVIKEYNSKSKQINKIGNSIKKLDDYYI